MKILPPPRLLTNENFSLGSTVRAAAFFSVGKRKSLSRAAPRRILAAGSDSSDDCEEIKRGGSRNPATFVTPSDEDPDDDVPLVHLGRQFLSDSKFGKVSSWLTKSPFDKKPGTEGSGVPRRTVDSSDEEVESLLKSDPEDGDVRPSWAAPLPPMSAKKKMSHSAGTRSSDERSRKIQSNSTSTFVGDRSSKAPLSLEGSSSVKTSTYVGDRSSKAPLSLEGSSSVKTSTYVGDRSSKAPLSLDDSSSIKTRGDSSSRKELNSPSNASKRLTSKSRTEENEGSKLRRGTITSQLDSRNISHTSREASKVVESCEKELDLTLEKLNHLDIKELPIVRTVESSINTELQSSLVHPKPKARPGSSIENSVNAVRCWSERTVSHADKQENQDSSGTSSDDLESFLTNLKTKPKEANKVVSSLENFIIPDDELDSEDDDSPQLSLRDRILKKSIEGKSKVRLKVVESSSEDEEESLPDIDFPLTRTEKEEVHVISSGEDSDGKPLDNLYEPKNYNLISSPAPPPVRATPKVKSVGKKQAGDTFKTPKTTAKKTLTFLSSLTADTPLDRCHPESVKYIKNFKSTKTELAERLYQMYNVEIFENALPDDMQITWNVRLTKTAGLCYSKRHKKYNIETRSSRIELSTKVIDSVDRLRDTLIHEMCHAASWIISGYRDGHGQQRFSRKILFS